MMQQMHAEKEDKLKMELEVEKWKSKAEVLAHQVESLKTHVKQVIKCSPEVEELKQSKS